ncbi:MAG: flavodoxin family protein [Bacteroidales bacterium]|nr:flavodoxin family protein [Bacteroidales bacterium]MBN2762085.1 flavodoxin family protein [Bacteroidales bacterium]
MKKALIVYQSRKGKTRKYGEGMARFLTEKGYSVSVIPVTELKKDHLEQISYLFLGCWTSGLYFVLQHPDRKWVKAIKATDIPENIQIGLFTTYIIATGSMFKAMKKYIPGVKNKILPEWKSKNGLLSESDKESLNAFIQ